MNDSWGGWGGDAGAGPPVSVTAGQEGVPCGRAGGGRAVPAGETQPACGQLIDVRGGDVFLLGSVAPDVPVSEIVAHDDDDVGLGCVESFP